MKGENQQSGENCAHLGASQQHKRITKYHRIPCYDPKCWQAISKALSRNNSTRSIALFKANNFKETEMNLSHLWFRHIFFRNQENEPSSAFTALVARMRSVAGFIQFSILPQTRKHPNRECATIVTSCCSCYRISFRNSAQNSLPIVNSTHFLRQVIAVISHFTCLVRTVVIGKPSSAAYVFDCIELTFFGNLIRNFRRGKSRHIITVILLLVLFHFKYCSEVAASKYSYNFSRITFLQ